MYEVNNEITKMNGRRKYTQVTGCGNRIKYLSNEKRFSVHEVTSYTDMCEIFRIK